MDFNINICKKILDTLPTGYYCGRRVPVDLDATAETSYYALLEDKIYISYSIIARGIENIPDTADFEVAVRSMLYHELSHAILTPINLFDYISDSMKHVMNVFEDERIETLLDNFYLKVNFKAQLYNILGNPKNPTDADTAFFNIVRYRVGPKKFIDEVEKIIEDFKDLNRNTINIYPYINRIYNLHSDICKLYKKNPDNFNLPNFDNLKQGDNKETTENQSIEAGTATATQEQNDALREAIKEIINKGLNPKNTLSKVKYEEVQKFEKMLEILFANFNKKNSSGNGINTYSGIFNPRAVVRKDYRYFERSIPTNGNNKFGTLHLNLFLDKSGSFEKNQSIVNAMLVTLSNIEKKNKNFKLDVYFLDTQMTKTTTLKEREMRCEGGNNIPTYAKQMVIDAQKPNTYNYNIILFDGDAFTNAEKLLKTNERIERFKYFDKKQTTLITDPENRRWVEGHFTSAKVIITKDYTNELIKNVTSAIQAMLS